MEKETQVRKTLFGFSAVALAAAAFVLPATGASAHDEPTCADVFGSGIEVHGQHVVGDYVTDLGAVLGNDLQWPPKGQVGENIGGNGGAVNPGGAGPGLHFLLGLAPGASFCVEQAHPNGFDAPENPPADPGNRD
jgi:hypothetical protein